MKYRVFGRRTGLRVSQLALGTGNFGTAWGHGAEKEEAKRIFDDYVDAGGNFIDCADNYQAGEAERYLGEFIASARDNLIVSTKYTMGSSPRGGEGISRTGNSRKNMMRSVEASLRRMNTPYIDLLWAHMPDGVTPLDEIMRGFDDLVRSGKVLYVGLSNFPAWRAARADLMASVRGWAPLVGIQHEYSLVERTPDRELLPMAEALGLGAALWSPLGGGLLTGKYRQGEVGRLTKLGVLVHVESTSRESALLDTVLEVARELDCSATQVAIAWLLALAQRSSTALVPILGSRTAVQLKEALGALEVVLSEEQWTRLEAVSAIPLGVPHEQINNSVSALAGGRSDWMIASAVPVV